MNYLTLVFDDGPHEPICQIADKIRAYGWSAAFAVIGRNIGDETLPMLKYVLDNGFQLVSHGQQHVFMEKLPSRQAKQEEIYTPVLTVRERLGYEMTMVRMPYLSEDPESLQIAEELHLPVLSWGIHNASDWNEAVTPDAITEAVLGSVCDGAVGCLHVRHNTCAALDAILPELKKRDYCLVTPDELFRQKGITPPLGVPIRNVNDFLK